MRCPLRRLCAVLLAAMACTALPAAAQEVVPSDSTLAEVESERQRVVLTDGRVIVGILLEERDEAIVLRSEDGLETTIPRSRIRAMGPLLERGLSRYDPTRTRFFFAPTARTLPRGAGRVSGYYFFPSIAYGFTDWLDVSVATLIPPLIISTVNVKARVLRLPSAQVAIGAAALVSPGNLVLFSAGDEELGSIGTMYGMVTIGSETTALTAGVFGGFAVESGETSVAPTAIGLLGFERQWSDRTKFVSENYIIAVDDVTAVLSLTGVRVLGERITVDIAAVIGGGSAGILASAVPYIGVAYNFGR